MTNFEKFMSELTVDKLSMEMMCPYDGADALPCVENTKLLGHCVECCKDWLMKEAETDA